GDAKSILRTQSRVAPLGKRATKWQGMERSVPQQPGKTRAPKSGAKSAVAPEQTACVRGGQKTPPFAGAKRRGRNREEANTRKEVNRPEESWQPFFLENLMTCQ